MIHWWLPGIVIACPATIEDEFTGDPSEVTCPVCVIYVQERMRQAREWAGQNELPDR